MFRHILCEILHHPPKNLSLIPLEPNVIAVDSEHRVETATNTCVLEREFDVRESLIDLFKQVGLHLVCLRVPAACGVVSTNYVCDS